MKIGLEIIAAERQRQIEQEGYTPEHDAEHIMSKSIKSMRKRTGPALLLA